MSQPVCPQHTAVCDPLHRSWHHCQDLSCSAIGSMVHAALLLQRVVSTERSCLWQPLAGTIRQQPAAMYHMH